MVNSLVLAVVCGLAALVAGQGYYTKGRTHSRGKGYFPALHGRLYGHSSYGHLYDRQRPAAAAAATAAGAPPPTQYDTYCDPRAAPKCAENGTTYCLLDFEYPVLEIKKALQQDRYAVKKYAELADQSAENTVEGGVSTLQEATADYDGYTGGAYDRGTWLGGAGYLCPSDVVYGRPVRARNTNGQWRVLVQNVAGYTQTQRLETCLVAGGSCRALAPCHASRCLQKHAVQRLLAYDPCDPYRGLFVDAFRLPSACSCHVP